MSKLFFDKLIVLEKVEVRINEIAESREEKEELWHIIDDMVHHRVMDVILEKLPIKYHDKFLRKYKKAPYDENIFKFLSAKVEDNIEEIIKAEIGTLAFDILEDLKGK